MKKKIFIDTNILLSGIFFRGNEAKLLNIADIDLFASDVVIEEAKEVVRRKFETFGVETCKIALEELENAIMDFKEIVPAVKYSHFIATAKGLIDKEKDAKILAAVLFIKPDYFVTGDADFNQAAVRKLVNLCRTKDFLNSFGLY